MKLSKVYSIALLAFFTGGCDTIAATPENAGLTESDLIAIKAASKLWVETYNKNDWAALADLFTPDAIMMPPNGPSVQGRDAIEAWEREYETGFRIAFQLLDIDGSGDVAYVSGKSCVFIPDESGVYGVDVGKFLEVRRRQSSGEWLIVADVFNSDLPLGADLEQACPFSEGPV